MPSALLRPDVRLPNRASLGAKVPTGRPLVWSQRGEEKAGQGLCGWRQPRPSLLHPPTVPPGDAPRVRGLGLRDSGRLAVRAALGWPFPAL